MAKRTEHFILYNRSSIMISSTYTTACNVSDNRNVVITYGKY
jgi:hypothetical protein